MPLKIDVTKDFAEVLRQRLSACGFPKRADEPDEQTIGRYLNLLNRSIEPRVRVTLKAANFTCPPEHQAGLDNLIRVSEAGGSLRPYQSKELDNDKFDDGMLNSWDVHHFHLGTIPHGSLPHLVARTGPQLYAIVEPDKLYCLDIVEHGGWSRQGLHDIVEHNFPTLFASGAINNESGKIKGLSQRYTDEEVKKLRSIGVNTLTQTSTGSITMGAGGGVTLSTIRGQKSLKVARAVDQIQDTLESLEEELNLQAERAQIPDNTEASLVERGDKLLIVSSLGELLFEITNPIVRMLPR